MLKTLPMIFRKKITFFLMRCLILEGKIIPINFCTIELSINCGYFKYKFSGWGNETQIIPNNSEQSSPEVQGHPVQTHILSVPPNNIRFRGNNRFMGGRGRGGREANNDSIRFEGNWKQQGSFSQTQIMSGPPPNIQHHSPFNPVKFHYFLISLLSLY